MDEKTYDKAKTIMVILTYCRESLEKVKADDSNIETKFKNSNGYCAFSVTHFIHFSIEEQKQIQNLTKMHIILILETKINKLEKELMNL